LSHGALLTGEQVLLVGVEQKDSGGRQNNQQQVECEQANLDAREDAQIQADVQPPSL
jgi:hypothetical protein